MITSHRRLTFQVLLGAILVASVGLTHAQTPTKTSTPTRTATRTPTSTRTPTPTRTATPTWTKWVTFTPTQAGQPTSTPTNVPTLTPSLEPTSTSTSTAIYTPTAFPTGTATASPTSTSTSVPPTLTLTTTASPTPTNTPTPEPTIPTLPNVEGEVAGSLTGSITVSDRGELSYSLKLSAPPGAGGMVPELSLNYSSKDGDGPLGIGWSLGGLSSVSRCARTAAVHGDADPVDFDGNDRFCLDGSELVTIAGTYGAHRAEYRTASDAIMRFFSQEVSGDGPMWFSGEGKNSLVYEFGKTSDARRYAPGKSSILQWLVNKVHDRSGNYYTIHYGYDAATGESWPVTVNYTMNDNPGGSPGTNSIQFTWGARSTLPQRSFVGGSQFVSSRALAKISYFAGSQLVREYRLGYSTQEIPLELRLRSITECGGGGECLPATLFDWAPTPSSGGGYNYVQSSTCDTLGAGDGFGSGSAAPLLPGDWNGDGRQDLARVSMSGVSLCLSNGNGFVGRQPTGPGLNTIRGCTPDTCFAFTGDWNGDGRLDFAHTGDGQSIRFFTTNVDALSYSNFSTVSVISNGVSLSKNPFVVGDFNGDGRTDFARVSPAGLSRYLSTPTGMQVLPALGDFGSNSYQNQTLNPLFAADFNGDGLTDVARVIDSYRYRFYSSRPDGTLSLYQDLSIPVSLEISQSSLVSPLLLGDWNGDGLQDFAKVSRFGTIFFDSTGAGFAAPRVINVFGQQGSLYRDNNYHPMFVGDWNRDGISDIARVSDTAVDFLVGKGDSLAWHSTIADFSWAQGYNTHENYPIIAGDWNSDGFADIARANIHDIRIYQHAFHEARALVGVTDGFGRRTDVQYSYLHDPSVYEPGSGSTYPWIDAKSGGRVVTSLATSNGVGGVARTRYKYFGARNGSVSGQGGAGFTRIETTNEADGSVSSVWYQQEAPFAGMPIREERRVSSGALVSKRVNTWASLTRPAGMSLPYISQTVEDSWDLDGTPIDRKTTTWILDEFASPTQIAVSHMDGYSETTVNEYRNDVNSWILGQLLKVRVTKVAPNFAPSTRTVAFQYNMTTDLLTREIIEPDSSDLKVEKAYTYDVFGNIISTTVSAVGAESKNDSFQFDPSGRFPVRITNSLGHVSEQTFDARHGLVASVTDPNGVMVQAVYDSFGRKIRVIRPDGTETRTLYLRAQGNGPALASYYTRTDSSGQAPILTYHDVVGRVIREERTGFDGRSIYIDRVFDSKGRQEKISDAYYEGAEILWNQTEYDLLGRPVWTTLPGNRMSHTHYQGRTTVLTDPLGKASRQTVNTLGKIVSSTDPMGGTVLFTYDSAGNVVKTQDPAGNITEKTYDLRGNATSVRDVDSGLTEITVDGFGRRILERRSDGTEVSVAYDKLDRIVSRISSSGIESWQYDSADYGIGKIARAESGDVTDRTFYDPLGRPMRSERTVGTTTLASTTSYDYLGRLGSVTYPSGFMVRRLYNPQGYFYAVVRSPDGSLVWRLDELSASGKVITETAGNGIVTRRSYDPATDFLNRIQADTRYSMGFSFDAVGNLTSRSDDILGLREEFSYDDLYRVTESRVVGQTPVSITYNAIGNITSKSDVGAYTYGENGAGAHAVTSISGAKSNTFAYDLRGNRVSALGESIEYTWFNVPKKISRSAIQVEYGYGPDNDRAEQIVSGKTLGSPTFNIVRERKLYFGGNYERVTDSTGVRDVHYIAGAEGNVAVYTTSAVSAPKSRYLHNDHLGSVQAISDESGVVIERISFDPWGLKRNEDWTPAISPPMSQVDRTFTGHEYIDELSLIHMGGRMYDPVVCRFLSVDPFIQQPENSQSLNRYSYVLNNPVSYTDPSGYFFKKLFKKVLKVAIIVAIAYAQPQLAAYLKPILGAEVLATSVSGAIIGVATSTVTSVVGGGSLADGFKAGIQGAPWSAASALVSFQIGSELKEFDPNGLIGRNIREAKAFAHGLAQGGMSTVRGDKFLPGMLSGAVSDYSSGFEGDFKLLKAVVSGSVASSIGGGKFEDGAMQAAFVHLYNFMSHEHVSYREEFGPHIDLYINHMRAIRDDYWTLTLFAQSGRKLSQQMNDLAALPVVWASEKIFGNFQKWLPKPASRRIFSDNSLWSESYRMLHKYAPAVSEKAAMSWGAGKGWAEAYAAGAEYLAQQKRMEYEALGGRFENGVPIGP